MSEKKREILKDVKVADLKPYGNNPYKHTKNIDNIKNSLGTFGYTKISIVVDEDMVLMTGHGTLIAITALEWETVPFVYKITGMDDKEKAAFRIADNETARGAELDVEKMIVELDFIEDDFAMEDFGLLGFTNNTPEETPPENSDQAPVNENEVKPGDLKTEHECPKCGYLF